MIIFTVDADPRAPVVWYPSVSEPNLFWNQASCSFFEYLQCNNNEAIGAAITIKLNRHVRVKSKMSLGLSKLGYEKLSKIPTQRSKKLSIIKRILPLQ
jgi:hypothetical protein